MHKFDLEKILASIAVVLLAIAVFFFVFAIPIYQYKDCKKVGHTALYCILNL